MNFGYIGHQQYSNTTKTLPMTCMSTTEFFLVLIHIAVLSSAGINVRLVREVDVVDK